MRSGKRGNTDEGPLATVTHARLRAAQGDAAAARRILRAILEADPGDAEARALLVRLAVERDEPVAVEAEDPIGPPLAGEPAALAPRFREALKGQKGRSRAEGVVLRFEAMLDRIARERRSRHAR